jgi:hypothetical protein
MKGEDGTRAVRTAVNNPNMEMVRLLLENGASILLDIHLGRSAGVLRLLCCFESGPRSLETPLVKAARNRLRRELHCLLLLNTLIDLRSSYRSIPGCKCSQYAFSL